MTVTDEKGTSSGGPEYLYRVPPPTPVVYEVTPGEGPAAGGQPVTIKGEHFLPGSIATIGSHELVDGDVVSETEITGKTPPGEAGDFYEVNVSDTNGGSGEGPEYVYVAAPAITSVAPGEGVAVGGTSVIIKGTGFTAAATVKFGAVAAKSVTYSGPTELKAESPAGSGTVDVTVETIGGSSAKMTADQFTYLPPPPTVTKLTPAEGPEAGKTTVTITGTGFTGTTAVSFGATPASKYKVESPTSISAEAPAGKGLAAVTVTTPGGPSAETPADLYTYTAIPIVSKLRPNEGSEAGETEVTIEGSGFTEASSVKFGEAAALRVTEFSATELRAVSPPGTGTVGVRVGTANGVSPEGPADLFKYVLEPKGRLGGLDLAGYCQRQGETDSGVWAGGKEWNVTLLDEEAEGENFAFGNWSCIPNHYESGPSFLPIAEKGPAPSFESACQEQYPGFDSYGYPEDPNDANSWICFADEPKVEKVAPAAGSTLGNGDVVITGSGFKGAARVEFGSTPATSFQVESSTEIVATTPPGSSGPVNVTVTTAWGPSEVNTNDTYVYTEPPTVSKLTPAEGPEAGKTTVTITGSGLTGATAVSSAEPRL